MSKCSLDFQLSPQLSKQVPHTIFRASFNWNFFFPLQKNKRMLTYQLLHVTNYTVLGGRSTEMDNLSLSPCCRKDLRQLAAETYKATNLI